MRACEYPGGRDKQKKVIIGFLSVRMFNFVPTRPMRHMKRYIAIISLLLASLVGLVTMVLPHHHHEDGHICLLLGNNTSEDTSHDTDEPLTCNDCPLKMQALQNTSSISSHGNDRDGMAPMIAVLWGCVELPEVDEHSIIPYYIVQVHCCMCAVCTLCGLRAPPAYVA